MILMNPPGRIGLHRIDCFRDGDRRWHCDQAMHVVVGTTDFQDLASDVGHNSSDIGIHVIAAIS